MMLYEKKRSVGFFVFTVNVHKVPVKISGFLKTFLQRFLGSWKNIHWYQNTINLIYTLKKELIRK